MSLKVLPALIRLPAPRQPLVFGQADTLATASPNYAWADVSTPGSPSDDRLIILAIGTTTIGGTTHSVTLDGVTAPVRRQAVSLGSNVKIVSICSMYVPSLSVATIETTADGTTFKDAMYAIYAMGADSELPAFLTSDFALSQTPVLAGLQTIEGGGLIIVTGGWRFASPIACVGNGPTGTLARDFAFEGQNSHNAVWSNYPTVAAKEDFTHAFSRSLESARIAASFG